MVKRICANKQCRHPFYVFFKDDNIKFCPDCVMTFRRKRRCPSCGKVYKERKVCPICRVELIEIEPSISIEKDFVSKENLPKELRNHFLLMGMVAKAKLTGKQKHAIKEYLRNGEKSSNYYHAVVKIKSIREENRKKNGVIIGVGKIIKHYESDPKS